jgi:hypothetical protein
MSALLQSLIEKVSALPEKDQDAFASEWLHELESERKWDELFANSQDELATMARRAVAEYRAGKTRTLESLRELHD